MASTLLLAEVPLRMLVSDDVIYGDLYQPRLSEMRYYYRFKSELAGAEGFGPTVGPEFEPRWDPELGWDYHGPNSGVRLPARIGDATYQAADSAVRPRVVFVGDSFTHGNEVQDGEDFPWQVGELSEVPIASYNLGVGGYGIGQAYLKLKRFLPVLEPHAVVFGIYYPGNFDRMTVSFYAFAKPLFTLDEGSLRVTNVPVPPPDGVDEWLDRDAFRALKRSRSLALAQRLIGRLVRPILRSKYYVDHGRVLRHILDDLKAMSGQHSFDVCFVLIPAGASFADDRAVESSREDRARQEISARLNEAGFETVDLLEAFLERPSVDRRRVYQDFYLHRDDGSIGHLSVRGNREAALTILDSCTLFESL